MSAVTTRTERYASLWILLPLSFGVLATAVTTGGLAFLQVYLQFFGERADQGDYAVAAGTTTGGAAFLLLGALTAWLVQGPRWLQAGCWMVAVAMTVATLVCLSSAHDPALEPADGYDTFASGVVDALSMPWNWVVVGAFLAAVAARYGLSGGSGAAGRRAP